MTLLQYLVSQYMVKYDVHGAATLPLPDPVNVSQAAAVDFDDLQRELNRLHAALEGRNIRLLLACFATATTLGEVNFR